MPPHVSFYDFSQSVLTENRQEGNHETALLESLDENEPTKAKVQMELSMSEIWTLGEGPDSWDHSATCALLDHES